MSDPFAVLPLALAAGSGAVDGVETGQWIAAGYTLLSRSAALVRTLSSARTAILLPPSGAFLTALAASDGRAAVLVNPLASHVEILRQLKDAGVTAAFTNSALAEKLPPDFPRVLLDDAPRRAIVVEDGRSRSVDLGSHFGLSLSGSMHVDGRAEEAVVVYTSAMAGTPLGAILTHRNLLFNARSAADAMADDQHDRCLVALPFAHLFGLIVAAASPLLRGATVNTMDRFHPGRALEQIASDGITRFMGVPSMYIALLHVIARRPGAQFRSHNLRLCFSGGAVVPEELQSRWFEATGVELRQGYGLTEAAPAALLTRADAINKRGTLGTPIAGTSVSIRDHHSGFEVPHECEGEICVQGPHVFAGYVGGATHGLQVRDGWLYTGDSGVKHVDGTFSFRGLIKPMFTRNGFNIYPREIEAALLRMPGVQAVHAWAIPDDTKENNIALRVTGTVNETDIKTWTQNELAAYKMPTHIEIVAG